jgi:hypothetical protein
MTLEEFTTSWLSESPVKPPPSPYERVDGNFGVTLFRDDRFQVQMWVFPSRAKVTDHSHPGLDSFVVLIAGKLRFRVCGKFVPLSSAEPVEWRGMKTRMFRVPAGISHGAEIGSGGASFLSVSERLDGKAPKSVHLIWDGPPLDNLHRDALKGAA